MELEVLALWPRFQLCDFSVFVYKLWITAYEGILKLQESNVGESILQTVKHHPNVVILRLDMSLKAFPKLC